MAPTGRSWLRRRSNLRGRRGGRGFVPIGAQATANGALRERLRGRTLFLICSEAAANWAWVLDWVLESPRPHVALFADAHEVRGVQGLSIGALTVADLVGSIRPHAIGGALRKHVEAAARRAHGSLETFAHLLWGGDAPVRSVEKTTRRRVAEEVEMYGTAPPPTVRMHEAPRPWPIPGELAALRRQMDAGLALLDRGRWAAGERALRQATQSFARRHDWPRAARGAASLADALVGRGQPRAAIELTKQARDYHHRGGDFSGES